MRGGPTERDEGDHDGEHHRAGPDGGEPLAQRCVDGEVTIHVERTFTLDEVPDALAHVGHGRALGKVVVEVVPQP